MPSKSASQHRLMMAVAHNPDFAKKAGIPQSVGRDFTEADKGRKFAKGGDMKESTMKKIFAGKETKSEEAKEKVAAKKAGMTYKAAEKKFEGEKYAKGGAVANKLKSGMWDTQKGWSVKGSASKSGLDAGNKSADGVAQRGKTKGTNVAMKRGGMCK